VVFRNETFIPLDGGAIVNEWYSGTYQEENVLAEFHRMI